MRRPRWNIRRFSAHPTLSQRERVPYFNSIGREAPHCVASLSYVYNHHERQLAERLTDLQHHAHDLVVSAMHVHLDHDHCLETLFLKGATAAVRELADKLGAERGVRHSSLNLIPVDASGHDHDHGHNHAGPLT